MVLHEMCRRHRGRKLTPTGFELLAVIYFRRKMMKIVLATLASAVLMIPTIGSAQRCDSIGASFSGGWKQINSAPHDGTVVEIMQTYGIAPWYGRFKWTKEVYIPDQNGVPHREILQNPEWVNLDEPGHSVGEECAFWRPLKPNDKPYVDPTGGAQKSVAYWCDAIHRPYDKKRDACVR
jgi:hypothetical protein